MFGYRFDIRIAAFPETGMKRQHGMKVAFYGDCQEITDGQCLKVCPSYAIILARHGQEKVLPINLGIPWQDLPEIRHDPQRWSEFGRLTNDDEHGPISLNRAFFQIALKKWLEDKELTVSFENEALVFRIDSLETVAPLDSLTFYFEFEHEPLTA